MRRIVFESDEEAEGGGNQMSAAESRALRAALMERLERLRDEHRAASSDEAREQLAKQIAEARRQVQALATEEAISQFVEDSEQYVIATGTIREELSRDPDTEAA